MRVFLVIGCLLTLISCETSISKSNFQKQDLAETQTDSLARKFLHVARSVQIPKKDSLKKEQQIDLMKSFFQADWKYSDYECRLLKGENLPKYPFDELYYEHFGIRKGPFKPTLLSLTDLDQKRTMAKVGFFYNLEEGFGTLSTVFNYLIVKKENEFKLTNMFRYNTKNWQRKTVQDSQFIAYPDFKFDSAETSKMMAFNQKIADYFNVNPISFKYYVCRNNYQLYNVRGFDFEPTMFLDSKTGGEAYPPEKLIFGANDSTYYPHELAHLYTYDYFPIAHNIINEGFATYMGGSQEMNYKEHLHILKNHLKTYKVDTINELLNKTAYTLTDHVSLKYSVGALLCALAEKKCGKEGLYTLLDSGETNRALLATIEELFGIEKAGFNGFIKKELENY